MLSSYPFLQTINPILEAVHAPWLRLHQSWLPNAHLHVAWREMRVQINTRIEGMQGKNRPSEVRIFLNWLFFKRVDLFGQAREEVLAVRPELLDLLNHNGFPFLFHERFKSMKSSWWDDRRRRSGLFISVKPKGFSFLMFCNSKSIVFIQIL